MASLSASLKAMILPILSEFSDAKVLHARKCAK